MAAVVGGVVGDEQDLAEVTLAVAVRNLRQQVHFRIAVKTKRFADRLLSHDDGDETP